MIRRIVILVWTIYTILLAAAYLSNAYARDQGQWQDVDPAISQWYKGLMQPDAPTASCCGEADAYWCDTIHVRKDITYCTITDDRDDNLLHRRHVAIGTEIEIPNSKLTWKDGNPTGHAIVFLSAGSRYNYGNGNTETGFVYCFVQNGGT